MPQRGPTFIMTLNDTHDLALPDFGRLIDRHGAFAVGFAYLRAAMARRKHPPDLHADTLGAHIRRDIGLPPRPFGDRGGRDF